MGRPLDINAQIAHIERVVGAAPQSALDAHDCPIAPEFDPGSHHQPVIAPQATDRHEVARLGALQSLGTLCRKTRRKGDELARNPQGPLLNVDRLNRTNDRGTNFKAREPEPIRFALFHLSIHPLTNCEILNRSANTVDLDRRVGFEVQVIAIDADTSECRDCAHHTGTPDPRIGIEPRRAPDAARGLLVAKACSPDAPRLIVTGPNHIRAPGPGEAGATDASLAFTQPGSAQAARRRGPQGGNTRIPCRNRGHPSQGRGQ